MTFNDYGESVSAMWDAMRGLEPNEFGRFTSHVAREITVCMNEVGISPSTDRATLELVLPMPFATAMAVAHVPDAAALPMLPEPFATFLRESAAACRRISASEDSGYALPIALGSQAATAVQSFRNLPPSELEGIDERMYLTWSIYRSYVEVLLQQDPLHPETERAALAIFQSGMRMAGLA
jgi:hypothetical protein